MIETTVETQAPIATVWRDVTDPHLSRQKDGAYISTGSVGAALGWHGLDDQPSRPKPRERVTRGSTER